MPSGGCWFDDVVRASSNQHVAAAAVAAIILFVLLVPLLGVAVADGSFRGVRQLVGSAYLNALVGLLPQLILILMRLIV